MKVYYQMTPEELDARMDARRSIEARRKALRRYRINALLTLGGCVLIAALAWLIVWGVTA